jgi:NADH-quinone oxidoreductase subunit A
VYVLTEYLPVLLFAVVSAVVGIALIVIGHFLGPRQPESEKASPYECGFEAF